LTLLSSDDACDFGSGFSWYSSSRAMQQDGASHRP
jgi:hypothetical protein